MASRAKVGTYRKLDNAGKVSHLQQRARGLKIKSVRASVLAIIDEHPEVLTDIQELLLNLGYDFPDRVGAIGAVGPLAPQVKHGGGPVLKEEEAEDDEEPVGGKSSVCDAASDVGCRSQSQTGGTGSSEDKGARSRVRSRCGIADDEPTHWLCHKYVSFETCSVPCLVDLLSAVEPVSFSSVALKGITARGRKEDKIKSLCNHLEFATGVSREYKLVGKLRHLQTLRDWLRAQCRAEGRRARDLIVPGTFSAAGDGVYSLVEEDGGVYVLDKTANERHEIPADEMLKFKNGQPIPMELLDISSNYSAEKAMVTSPRTSDTVHIITLGHFGRKGKRLAKFQLALGDDDVDLPTAAKKTKLCDEPSADVKTYNKDRAEGSAAIMAAPVVPAPAKQEAAEVEAELKDSDWAPQPPACFLKAEAVPAKAEPPATISTDDYDDVFCSTPPDDAVAAALSMSVVNWGEGACKEEPGHEVGEPGLSAVS